MLEIIPIHFDGLNCFEDSLISIAGYFNREYLLAFSESLDFRYIPIDSRNPQPLGNRIVASDKNLISLINKYCGIGFIEVQVNTINEIVNTIKYQLEIGLPTAISIDTYWCSWCIDYQKKSGNHICLAIGIDKHNNIICIDPNIGLDKYCFPIKDFNKLKVLNPCYVLQVTEIPSNMDYLSILKDSIKKLKSSNLILNFESFINEFIISLNFTEEFKNFRFNTTNSNVPIQKNLRFFGNARTLYFNFINYISEKTNFPEIVKVSNELLNSNSKWMLALSLLIKANITGYTESTKEKVHKVFRDILEIEKRVINDLDLITKNANLIISNNYNKVPDNFFNYSKTYTQNYIFLDLNQYFNNIAFHSILSNDCLADFTGTGYYFLSEDAPSFQTIDIDGNKFEFPKLSDGRFDNISCEGQTLDIPQGIYKRMMILAVAEWGCFVENIKLNLNKKDCINIQVNFSDWACTPQYDEQIAWSGKAYSKEAKKVFDTNHNIFSLYREFNNVQIAKSITLPNCPNLHIFAITLS